jgi:tetratricopeptide (TPR) repeat protein
VLTGQQQVLGKEHPEIARVLDNLGTTYHIQGNLTRAQACYEQALSIRLKILGPHSPLTARSWSYLGDLWHDKDDVETARRLYQQALKVFEKSYFAYQQEIHFTSQKLMALNGA